MFFPLDKAKINVEAETEDWRSDTCFWMDGKRCDFERTINSGAAPLWTEREYEAPLDIKFRVKLHD